MIVKVYFLRTNSSFLLSLQTNLSFFYLLRSTNLRTSPPAHRAATAHASSSASPAGKIHLGVVQLALSIYTLPNKCTAWNRWTEIY